MVGFVVWIGHWSSWKNKMAGKRLIGRTWAHTPWQPVSYPVVLDPIGKELNPPNYWSLTILSKPRPKSHKAGQTYPILFHHFRMAFVGQKLLFHSKSSVIKYMINNHYAWLLNHLFVSADVYIVCVQVLVCGCESLSLSQAAFFSMVEFCWKERLEMKNEKVLKWFFRLSIAKIW